MASSLDMAWPANHSASATSSETPIVGAVFAGRAVSEGPLALPAADGLWVHTRRLRALLADIQGQGIRA